MKREYALYKGDEFICLGTENEIAKHQNIKIESVKFMKSPTYKKRCKSDYNNRKIIIEIESEDMCE